MGSRTAITVLGSPDEVRRMWQEPSFRPEYIGDIDAAVTFREAPGDRGTEIYVALEYTPPLGSIGVAVGLLTGEEPAQQVADDLRRFKQIVERGGGAWSAATAVDRTVRPRPAQPADRQLRQPSMAA